MLLLGGLYLQFLFDVWKHKNDEKRKRMHYLQTGKKLKINSKKSNDVKAQRTKNRATLD